MKDGRHINITSAEKDYLNLIKRQLGLRNKIGLKLNGAGKVGYQLQLGNVRLWRQLQNLGLSPRKSLIMSSLRIPDSFFPDFLRGVIDGDGCIRRWNHPQNGNEQWCLVIYSSAPLFTKWLYEKIEQLFKVRGVIITQTAELPRHPMYRIKLGKLAARRILGICYKKESLSLKRKYLLAEQCVASYVGWTRSLTVKNIARVEEWHTRET